MSILIELSLVAFLVVALWRWRETRKEADAAHERCQQWQTAAIESHAALVRTQGGVVAETSWRDFARYSPPDVVLACLIEKAPS